MKLLLGLISVAIIIAACAELLANDPTVLKPRRTDVVERNTVEVWCSGDTCEATSGRTVRVKWVIPRNKSEDYRNYELYYNQRLFKVIVRSPGDEKSTWYADVFVEHKRQKVILLAAVSGRPHNTVIGNILSSITLPHGGDWVIWSWVDECKELRCPAPVTYLQHKY